MRTILFHIESRRGLFCTFTSFLILALSTSCASFAKGNVPEAVLPAPISAAMQVDVTVDLTWTTQVGAARTLPPNVNRALEDEFIRISNESQLVSMRRGQLGDVHVSARMKNQGSLGGAVGAAMITAFSLGTIPTWASDHYILEASVTSQSGRKSDYRLEDSMKTYFWIPLIFVAPFKRSGEVAGEIRTNMIRALVVRIHEDGYLTRAGSPPPTVRSAP